MTSRSSRRFRTALLTLALSLPLTASAQSAAPAPLLRDIAPSLYEVVYSPISNAVFVASASSASGNGGVVYQLAPDTLAVVKRIELAHKPFGLAIDEVSNTLYVGHTLDGAVSVIDAGTGTVKTTLRHGIVDAEGKPVHVRELAVDADAGRLFVGGIDEGGFLWVIDIRSLKTERILRDADLPSVGLTVDAPRHRLYLSGTAAYSVLDTHTLERISDQRIAEKLNPEDGKRRFLVNTAVNADGKHLFANQLNNGEGTLVFDANSGALLKTIATGQMPLGIRFNPQRNEFYVASRESGTFNVIDASTYQLKHSLPLPTHPNTIAISADGNTAWVTVKQASAGRGGPKVDEQVARIDLRSP